MQIVKLNFWGYTWEQFRLQIDYQQGILLVYRGFLDAEGFVRMKEIVYVDYSNIHELYHTPVMSSIKESIVSGEMLFFSLAEVDQEIANDVKALLVDAVKPMFNERVEVINSKISIECIGNCDLLPHIINN